jgi:diguanylate cyclase (GGDEF)-like protein
MSSEPVHLSEAQFQSLYAANTQPHVRRGLWLTMGITLLLLFGPKPIATHRSAMLAADQLPLFDAARYGVMLPTIAIILFAAYSRHYLRYFQPVAQTVILVHVACLTLLEIMVHRQGYSVAVWMALAIIGIFHAYALTQQQALRTALIATTIYLVGGYTAGLQDTQWLLNTGLLLFVLLGGISTHASLMAASRAQYQASLTLSEFAQRDALTQLHNRRAFDERIEMLWQQATRARTSIGLLLIDIDYFKNYNDAAGHLSGDACLAQVATIIARSAQRPMDMVARFGGEEFVVLLYDVDQETLSDVAQAVRVNIAAAALPHPNSPIAPIVTASIGGACVIPDTKRSVRGVIQLADEALYAAKKQGRDRVVVYGKEHQTLVTGRFRTRQLINNDAA